jgi:chemotaxis protein MotA
MLLLFGILIVAFSILAGFLVSGGQVAVLLQWAELLIIGGAAIGSLLVSTPPAVLKKLARAIFDSGRPRRYGRQDYLELLKTFYEIFLVAQKDGLAALEDHVEDPWRSDVLSKNHRFIEDESARTFFCDTLKVMLSGRVTPHELESLMDTEIETCEAESRPLVGTLSRIADSLPGLGIVAAVLGIIVTMSSIDQGAEYVGRHVAAALVGTFLGVLLCYGFVGPLATNVEHTMESKIRYLLTIKACIAAWSKGHSPILAVEMARRTISSESRPSFMELEKHVRRRAA